MKKRVVSILIAGILFFSNIGVTSFAANNSSSEASSAASSASTEGSTVDAQKKSNEGEDEISYYKITDFSDLPENISNQKIRVGGKLEDLELPDSLEVTVEPDYEHDERIERGLAQERERLRKEREEQEKKEASDEASSNDSDDESEAASSASSGEDDGEKIIFFDDGEEGITDDPGELSGEEESDSAQEETTNDSTTITEEPSPTSDSPETNNTDTEKAEKDKEKTDKNKEKTDKETNDNVPSESSSAETSNEGASESSEETSDGASENSLISWITHTFSKGAVAYAADAKDRKASDKDKSVEIISDVEWILEPEYNYDTEEFSADEEGKIYLFTPVLLIPDTYYIEDELPIITVTVTDDYYAFDKEVVVDDVKIRVRADKGVFPEDSRVTAKKLADEDEQKVKELVDEKLEDANVVKEYTFDITVKDEEGNEVQPDTQKGRVVVSFETEEVADEKLAAEMYHIIDESKDEKEPEDAEPVALGGEREKERVLTIYDENSVLKAEKLEAEVVEIEDAKVLEAETSGFSVYKVVFTRGEYTFTAYSNIISVDEMTATVLEDIEEYDSVDIDIKAATDYLYMVKRSNESLPGANSKGIYEKSENENDENENDENENDEDFAYLIVKRPFKTLTINAKCMKDGKTDSKKITVINGNSIDPVLLLNNDYPVAEDLGSDTFDLSVEVTQLDANDVVLYQWQKSKSKDSWSTKNDIPGANCAHYMDSKIDENDDTVNSNYENNYWYRCCVNGVYTEPVRIITANSTGNWAYHYGDGDQCYVSNGIMAYTVDKSNKIDIVGYFNGDGKKQILNSSFGGNGWTICCGDATGTSVPDVDDNDDSSHLWFSFDKKDSTLIHVSAGLTDDKFSIFGNAQVGKNTKETTLAVVDEDDETKLLKLATISSQTQDSAQATLNNGQGSKIPVFEIIPKTPSKSWYIGQVGTQDAYADNQETLRENNISGIAASWEVDDDINEILFDFKLSGLNTAGVLKAYTKKAVVNFSGTTNIIAGKENGNQLTVLARSLGTPTENVTVEMDMKGKNSGSSTLSTVIANDYKATTTQTVNSSSATSTQYKADYLDIKVTKEVGDEKATEVKESEFTSNVGIELSYNFENKDDIRVYRVHDNVASRLSDNSYKIDKENGKIYIYTKQFSEYAVAYKTVTTYVVTFNDGNNNKWTVNVKNGEKVAAPESMPTKDGVTALYWYKVLTSSSSSTSKPTAYDFNTPVTSNITLTAYYPKTYTVTFSGITPSTTVKVAEGDKVARPADPVKEGYTFKGWYADKTSKTLYNFDTAVTKDLTLYAGFVDANGNDADDEDSEEGGSRAPDTNDTLPPVWLWVLILIGGAVAFSCNLYARAKVGKVKFSDNKTVRKITRVFLLIGLVIVTVARLLIKKVNEKKRETALVLSGAVVLIAAGVLIFTSIEYHRSEKAYGDASKTYVQETQEIPLSASVTDEVNSADNSSWWNEASVEMETLTEEYPDAIGWIYFENEDISYPIMYSGDNTKYLNTSYDGEKARAGAIFLDGESTPDFSDPHSLIYGHNMRDLTMFGKLRYYKTDASYYDEHQYFQIFTKDGVYRYQIFAYEEVPDSHDVFWVYGKNPEGMWDMLQDIEGGSYRQTGIEATESDHVITLATCTSKEDRRLIVSALRTDEHDYEYVASN